MVQWRLVFLDGAIALCPPFFSDFSNVVWPIKCGLVLVEKAVRF